MLPGKAQLCPFRCQALHNGEQKGASAAGRLQDDFCCNTGSGHIAGKVKGKVCNQRLV